MATGAHARRPLNDIMMALVKAASGGKGRIEWGGVRRVEEEEGKEEGSDEVRDGRDFIKLKCFIDSWNLWREGKEVR